MSNNIQQALLSRNLQVPRYTSYPTAPHFHDQIDGTTATRWLADLSTDIPLSLYFHIPFCKKLCWYCGCNTKATLKYAPVTKYLAYLKKEITLVASKLGEKRLVSHIHFGGGSPSYLVPDDFQGIMAQVHSVFDLTSSCEIAIELDPREITEPKVAAYRLAGVNRVSLGVQDFDLSVQKAINRVQPLHMIYDAVKLLRDYGINHINMDLLYGLPLQTEASILQNIDIAAGLAPSRISLFGYAHVPWMKKHMQLIDEAALPDATERYIQFDAARKALANKGYKQIGLDHFVRYDDPMIEAYKTKELHRNFQGYTTDSAEALIGFGPSAISALPQGYLQNTSINNDYFRTIDQNILPTVKGVPVTEEDRVRRALINELMCYLEVDLMHFGCAHGLPLNKFDHTHQALQELADDKLISFDGSHIKINPDATQAVRLVCALFDEYFQASKARHAQVA